MMDTASIWTPTPQIGPQAHAIWSPGRVQPAHGWALLWNLPCTCRRLLAQGSAGKTAWLEEMARRALLWGEGRAKVSILQKGRSYE